MAIIKSKTAVAKKGGVTKTEPATSGGASAVFVRGFDFGTTQSQLEDHCNVVGTVTTVKMGKGTATVTFSSPEEAQAAVEQLNKSTIEGNSRFIDVSIDKKSLPPKPGMGQKRTASQVQPGLSCRVFVRGFDFGTTDEQFEGHMGSVGTIENVKWVTKGSAEVTYSSPEEAAAAVEQLQKTTIEGNSRFIDVLAKDDNERPAKRFNSGGNGAGNFGGKGKGKGGGNWIDMNNINLQQLAALAGLAGFGGGKSWGKGGGASKGKGGKKRGDHKDEDPAGSGRVFVRGFDFGTDDETFKAHMSAAGPIHTVHWVSKGSAVVVYKKKGSAAKAASQLNQSTVEGNTRYIDVILKDAE